jgi:hypothetical protein
MSSGEETFNVDPDLIGEESVGKVKRTRRGRPKEEPEPSPKQRPFIESNIGKELAKSDLSSVMNRWDWESGDYEVAVKRSQPKTFQHQNTFGYVGKVSHAIDESYIQQHWGGGIYDIVVRGPHAKSGQKNTFLQGCRVKISGDPIVTTMMDDYADDGGGVFLATPQSNPVNISQAGRAKRVGSWIQRSGGGNSGGSSNESDSMLRMSFEAMSKQAKESANEAASLRSQLISSATKRDGSPVNTDLIKIIQSSADRAIEAEKRTSRRYEEESQRLREEERTNRKEFDQVVERFGKQHGMPIEMMQSMIEQHRSELAALVEANRTQASHDRERYDRELELIRETGRGEVTQVRNELQGRLDRELDLHKTELNRLRSEHEKEVTRIRDEFSRKIEEEKKDFLRQLEAERERVRIDRESVEHRFTADREAMVSQHQMQVDHLKSIHDGQVTQLTFQSESQIKQLTSQNDVSMRMQENTYQARISSLENELKRTRNDLSEHQKKLSDQGDLATQATKLKSVGESLQGVFGFGGGAISGVDKEEEKEEVKGWLGTLIRLGESNIGAGLLEIIKQAASAGMGGVAAVPMTAGALPGQSYQYGIPPQAQQYYYQQPPQQPPQQPYQPVVQEVVDEEEVYEEEPEEVIRSNVGKNGVISAETPPISADLREETVQESVPIDLDIHSRISGDGVVRAKIPPPYVPPVEVVPKKVVQPVENQVVADIKSLPPEIIDQIKNMILGIEESMKSGVAPEQLVETLLSVGTMEQLTPLAVVSLDELVAQISEIVPGSMLTSYNGRKYLTQFQNSLKSKLS